MKTFSTHLVRNVLAFVVVTGIAYGMYMTNPNTFNATKVEATSAQKVSGFAWSENIGWISLNNTSDLSVTPYGVDINPLTGTGIFSGSAWSENIGWISFDRTRTGNPPSAPFNGGVGPIAQVDWATGKVTGWMRAISACQNNLLDASGNCTGSGAGDATGGWDGWIKLSDDTVAVWNGKGVKISLADGKFSGYAWSGGDIAGPPAAAGVVGWVDFAPLVGGLPIAEQPIVTGVLPSCSLPSTPWGPCTTTTTCTKPPDGATKTIVGGGTQSCLDGTGANYRACDVTITCSSSCGNTICEANYGETFGTCPADCKIKTKFQQF